MPIKRLYLIIFIVGWLIQQNYAQPQYPRISPAASVSQVIGISKVTVNYHRPGVKNRLVWGGLVPLDKIWRAGANEATTIEFSHDVTIGNQLVPAGKYSFFIMPTTESATVILNKNADLWGTYGYNKEDDLLRMKAKLDYLDHQEWLVYTFENLSPYGADLVMRWEDFGVRFGIHVDTDKYVLEGARQAKGWKELLRAATYCLENNVALDEGQQWIDQSIQEDENYWNLSLKARYLAKKGQFDGARHLMTEAIEMGRAMEKQPDNLQEMEQLLSEW